MNKKLSPDAFAYYWSLGSERSYQAVADKYGVSKRAVVSVAKGPRCCRKEDDRDT
ncbi:MAG: hypothetical protein ACYTG7_25970 [Planctomycetota bacterium]|jgi:hypothetical protein